MPANKQTGIRKRVFDFVSALVLIILLFPLMAVVGVLVWFNLGSPVFFHQVRPGRNGELFKMWKFRTMKNLHGMDGVPLPDEKRLTRFGTFLRSTSLDELPELINVIRGEMSLVGPRPLLVEYLDEYTEEQNRRHEVRPGITGWAQVNGRNSLSWDEKFALDVWYVDNQSLRLDLNILLRTLMTVVARNDVSAKGHATMPPFRNSESQTRGPASNQAPQNL